MKKIFLVLVAVFLLVIGATVFFFFRQSHQPIAIENVLPAKPVFYLRATNVSRRIDAFTTTKLFNDLKNLDYKKLATLMNVSEKGTADTEQKLNNLFSSENQNLLKSLFGREFAIAIYSDDALKNLQAKSKADVQKVFTQLAGNVFIATRVAPDVTAAEVVLKFTGQFNKDFKTESKRYAGKEITSVISQDGSFVISYVRFKDILVMGIGEKAARSAIDVFVKKQKALSSDEDFVKRANAFVTGADTVGFFDIRPITEMINAQIAEMASAPQSQAVASQLNEQLKQTRGLEALTFANSTGDVLTGKVSLYFDKAKLDPSMAAFYSCAPDDNRSAKFVPWDALFYEWGTCLDFPLMWSQYKEQLVMRSKLSRQPMDVNKMISGYEQMLGLSIESDVIPALGKEFGIYLNDVDTTGTFPIPKLVGFVQITARDKATTIINKLLALQPALQPVEETYNGELIRYIPIPFADSFKLGYTFIDNYLLLATNVDILKASLDAQKNPDKSIVINTALRATDGKKNSVFFIQNDRLMSKASDLIDWTGRMAKQSVIQRQAFLTGAQKSLTDIKTRNEVLNSEIKTKQNSLLQLEATPDATAEVTSQKDVLNKGIEDAQKELNANEDRAKNLNFQIKSFESKAPKDDDKPTVMEQFVKPLLKALSNIRYFSTVTINGDGVLESTIQTKIE